MQRVSLWVRRLLAASALFIAAGLAQAELYRWVDQNGITNYSNHKPRDAAARNVSVVEDRLSVYTPDKRLLQAMETFREQRAQAWELAALQRAYDAERELQSAAPPSAYAAPTYGYFPDSLGHGVLVVPRHPRHLPRLVQPELPPGRTAGMIVEQQGLVPGTTGFGPPRPRAVLPREPGAGHAGFTIRGAAGPLAPSVAPPPTAGFTIPGTAGPTRGGGRGR